MEEKTLAVVTLNAPVIMQSINEAIMSICFEADYFGVVKQLTAMKISNLVKRDRAIVIPVTGSIFNRQNCEIHKPFIVTLDKWDKTLADYADKNTFLFPLPIQFDQDKVQKVNFGNQKPDVTYACGVVRTAIELLFNAYIDEVAEAYMDYYDNL